MPIETVILKCPICEGPMQRVSVLRATGEMQSIKCPECNISSFLSRNALERLQTRLERVSQTRSAPGPGTQAKPVAPPAEPAPAKVRVAKTLYQAWVDGDL